MHHIKNVNIFSTFTPRTAKCLLFPLFFHIRLMFSAHCRQADCDDLVNFIYERRYEMHLDLYSFSEKISPIACQQLEI